MSMKTPMSFKRLNSIDKMNFIGRLHFSTWISQRIIIWSSRTNYPHWMHSVNLSVTLYFCLSVSFSLSLSSIYFPYKALFLCIHLCSPSCAPSFLPQEHPNIQARIATFRAVLFCTSLLLTMEVGGGGHCRGIHATLFIYTLQANLSIQTMGSHQTYWST